METRNFKAGAAAAAPTAPLSPSTGYATDGNPATGTLATQPGAFWFHKIGEELRAVVTSAAITPSDTDLAQVAKAIQSGKLTAGSNSGTANALVAAFLPVVATLVDGMVFSVRAVAANTGAATFTPNTGIIAAKSIVKGANTALVAGDIIGGGHWVDLQYDATLDKWVMLNPAFGANNTGYMLVQDQKASGTNGGDTVAGTQTRTLNTVVNNTISGASLATNQITLPAGTYRVRAITTSFASNLAKAFLYNITSTVNQLIGMSCNGSSNSNSDATQISPEVCGRFTLSSQAVFELRMYTNQGTASVPLVAGRGLGSPCSQGIEVYSSIEIFKES